MTFLKKSQSAWDARDGTGVGDVLGVKVSRMLRGKAGECVVGTKVCVVANVLQLENRSRFLLPCRSVPTKIPMMMYFRALRAVAIPIAVQFLPCNSRDVQICATSAKPRGSHKGADADCAEPALSVLKYTFCSSVCFWEREWQPFGYAAADWLPSQGQP